MVFITEGFFEVAIESWPEWDLNPRPLNSVQTLKATELSGHQFNSRSEPTLRFIYDIKYITVLIPNFPTIQNYSDFYYYTLSFLLLHLAYDPI